MPDKENVKPEAPHSLEAKNSGRFGAGVSSSPNCGEPFALTFGAGCQPTDDLVEAMENQAAVLNELQIEGEDEEDTDADRLLSAEEERILGRLVAAGKALGIPDAYTIDEPYLTAIMRSQGLGARNLLILRNLRLVYREAVRYRNQALDLADLVQEGCIGLLQAANRFDPERGFRFSTYAVPWIKQAVDRAALTQARAVRIPRRKARKVGDDEQERQDMLPAASLEASAGNDEAPSLADQLADPEADPESDAIRAVMLQALWKALHRCSERERQVIVRRYGLAGQHPESHEAIANDLGVSRERVRQIEMTTLKRLRLSDGLHDPDE